MQTALDIASALEVSLGELIGDPVAPLDEARLTPGHIGEVERDVEAMGEVEAQILEKARQLEAERTRIRRKGAAPRELQALWLDAFTSNEGLTNFVERTWGEEYRKTPRHARVRHALNRLDKALADMGDVVHKVRHDYESQPANVRHLEIPNQDTA
jgi:hypothetical protein